MLAESGKQLLNLMFDQNENVCVSHNGYGYHSVPLKNLKCATIELKAPPGSKLKDTIINVTDIKLISINPIYGWRRDENCTAFRTFLVEMDNGPLTTQHLYVRNMGMPYSACVFSGGKSLHFAITLEKDLPNYEIYYYYANWILNVMNFADPNTKNPSRSIRMPGANRNGKLQRLIEIKNRVSKEELDAWLSRFDGLRPKNFNVQKKTVYKLDNPEMDIIPAWVFKTLANGVNNSAIYGRNVEWFKIASEFGKAGFDEEQTIAILDNYFSPEYDFKRSEWLTTIRSGVRNGLSKIGNE